MLGSGAVGKGAGACGWAQQGRAVCAVGHRGVWTLSPGQLGEAAAVLSAK